MSVLFRVNNIVHRHNTSWNHQSLCGMVVANFHIKYMRSWSPSSQQSMDVSERSCLLRCIGHMGTDRAEADIRITRILWYHELVLPWWCNWANSSMATPQRLPKAILDSSNQSPRVAWSDCNDAPSDASELQCLGSDRNRVQFRRLSVQEAVVAEIQLHSFSCIGWGIGFHGCVVVFLSWDGRKECGLVGNCRWALWLGCLSYSQGCGGW